MNKLIIIVAATMLATPALACTDWQAIAEFDAAIEAADRADRNFGVEVLKGLPPPIVHLLPQIDSPNFAKEAEAADKANAQERAAMKAFAKPMGDANQKIYADIAAMREDRAKALADKCGE
jgi:hypothetical protein